MTDHTGAARGADDAKDRRAPNEPLSTDEVDSVSGGLVRTNLYPCPIQKGQECPHLLPDGTICDIA